jgi:hypothetical protein
MKKHNKQPPYSGSLVMKMPDGSQKTVRLPTASLYEEGEREVVAFVYKERSVTVKLVRIKGGWDITT